jgi:hypothetical protein
MTDTKLDTFRVAENIHSMLRILRTGAIRYEDFPVVVGMTNKHTPHIFMDTRRVVVAPRSWHADLQRRFNFHPVIDKLLQDHRPIDWHQLVLEYPHQAETDRNRIAYTQNDRKGEDDIQTVTSLAKYIRRHFPALGDHVIRDTVAAYTVTGCKIIRNVDEMIYHIERGPSSCMVRSGWNVSNHPYRVYCPSLGWGLAVRVEGDETIGRALVNDRNMTYVRTYLRSTQFSHSDHDMEAWLTEQGYTKASSWEGLQFLHIPDCSEFVAPYLDGDVKNVDLVQVDGKTLVEVHDDGEYRCDQTSGSAYANNGSSCEDCNDHVSDGDGYWVGQDESSLVCQSCCDNDYYYAYGRRGRQYYVHGNNVVHVGDETYDEDYLGDNNIIELRNGDYCHSDSAVYIESEDVWYEDGDDEVCYDDHNSRHELVDNCVQLENGDMCHTDDAWMCQATMNYYTNDEEYVEVDGEKYHPDHVPETETEETEPTQGESL